MPVCVCVCVNDYTVVIMGFLIAHSICVCVTSKRVFDMSITIIFSRMLSILYNDHYKGEREGGGESHEQLGSSSFSSRVCVCVCVCL
jgi:hypothetical protein